MSCIFKTQGGGSGGEEGFFASIFVKGLSEADIVTASNGSKIKSGVWNAEETRFEISKIGDLGMWTVTATNGEDVITQDVLVDVATEFEIEMQFYHVPTNGLIAEYLFENDTASTIFDTSGNGINLTNLGATFVDALGGKGMQTSGNNYIDASALTAVLPATYEISLAVNFGTNRPVQSNVLDFYPIGIQKRWVCLAYNNASGALIAVNKNQHQPELNPERTNFIFMGANTTHGWYQINDEDPVTSADVPYTSYSKGYAVLGNAYNNAAGDNSYVYPMTGFVAKIRVYNRQLTAEERAALYNYGRGL